MSAHEVDHLDPVQKWIRRQSCCPVWCRTEAQTESKEESLLSVSERVKLAHNLKKAQKSNQGFCRFLCDLPIIPSLSPLLWLVKPCGKPSANYCKIKTIVNFAMSLWTEFSKCQYQVVFQVAMDTEHCHIDQPRTRGSAARLDQQVPLWQSRCGGGGDNSPSLYSRCCQSFTARYAYHLLPFVLITFSVFLLSQDSHSFIHVFVCWCTMILRQSFCVFSRDVTSQQYFSKKWSPVSLSVVSGKLTFIPRKTWTCSCRYLQKSCQTQKVLFVGSRLYQIASNWFLGQQKLPGVHAPWPPSRKPSPYSGLCHSSGLGRTIYLFILLCLFLH